jgi:predicted lipoprotein with Yx(FWY)xxD motif
MGVKQSLLGRLTRPNGKMQVTYNGHPLYRYSGDTKAGQTSGQGIDGKWYAVKANGNHAATRR